MPKSEQAGKRVLLVVDVQKGVVAAAHGREAVIATIARIVDRARKGKLPVIWVRHSDAGLVPGNPDWEIVPELRPAADESIIDKNFNSCFEGTDLKAILDQTGAREIVLTGAQSNWCIRATAHGALERGFDLTLVSDAHTTESVEFGEGRRIEAESIIAELNAAMAWMSYPGRVNRAVKAAELDF